MKKKLNIFISYRRDDSINFAGRLHDNLISEYQTLFFDTEDGIGAGEKFLSVIVKSIEEADVFLMVVGKESAKGFKAREAQDDYVLKEIIQAQKSSCTIIPILVNGVDTIEYLPSEIASIHELSFYRFSHDKFSLNMKALKQEIDKCLPKLTREHSFFVSNLLEKIESERAMVLFSQEFTNIESYFYAIKKSLKVKFSENFYKISIPSYESKDRYFASIAKSCGIKEEVKELQDWKDAMQKKLKNSEEVMLLVTDLEEGKDEYNVALAITLRNLSDAYSNLFILFVGRKKLAGLVLQNGKYSPLASLIHHRNRLFFPNEKIEMEEEDVVQEFENLLPKKSHLCELLKKEKIKRFTAWSGDSVINQLFWKNLLVRRDKHLVWRSEEIMMIGKEVLECSK